MIHTTEIFKRTALYIGRISRGNVRARIPFSVWIEKRIEHFVEAVNFPPEFVTHLKSKVQFNIDDEKN